MICRGAGGIINLGRGSNDVSSEKLGLFSQATGMLGAASVGSAVTQTTGKFVFKATTGKLADFFKNGAMPKASELVKFAERQGWKLKKTINGPSKYVDGSGVARITIKRGSSRTPGSGSPHVELRNASGQRINPSGNSVTQRSAGNHTPIDFDL